MTVTSTALARPHWADWSAAEWNTAELVATLEPLATHAEILADHVASPECFGSTALCERHGWWWRYAAPPTAVVEAELERRAGPAPLPPWEQLVLL